MKIAIIGATGTIGKAIVGELSARHDIVSVKTREDHLIGPLLL